MNYRKWAILLETLILIKYKCSNLAQKVTGMPGCTVLTCFKTCSFQDHANGNGRDQLVRYTHIYHSAQVHLLFGALPNSYISFFLPSKLVNCVVNLISLPRKHCNFFVAIFQIQKNAWKVQRLSFNSCYVFHEKITIQLHQIKCFVISVLKILAT